MRFTGLILLISLTSYGQSYFQDHFGGKVTIYSTIGTHSSGIGFKLSAWYQDYFYQFNATTSIRLYAHNYGGRQFYIESKNGIGVLLLGGKRNSSPSLFLDDFSNQSNFKNAFGYQYIFYRDTRSTSQNSAAFMFESNGTSLYFENDALAGQGRDRFRTGAMVLSHRIQNYKLDLGFRIWTGETRGARWQKLEGEDHPYGFKILEDLPYGKTSHGVFFGGFGYNLNSSQYSNVELGIDSEHIRNFVQNKVVHDMPFVPKRIERTTPHYPRLDPYGCPAFEKEDARKNKLFYQIGTGIDRGY